MLKAPQCGSGRGGRDKGLLGWGLVVRGANQVTRGLELSLPPPTSVEGRGAGNSPVTDGHADVTKPPSGPSRLANTRRPRHGGSREPRSATPSGRFRTAGDLVSGRLSEPRAPLFACRSNPARRVTGTSDGRTGRWRLVGGGRGPGHWAPDRGRRSRRGRWVGIRSGGARRGQRTV